MDTVFQQLKDYQFFGNTALQWLLAIGLSTVFFLALKLCFSVLQRRISSLSERTNNVVDDLIASALKATKVPFLLVAGIWVGISWALTLGHKAGIYLDFTLLIVVVIQIALWSNRMVSAYIEFYTKAKRDDNPASVSIVQGLSFIVRLAIWSIAILLLIDNLGYDVTALVAGFGISGIAIALAVQNILGDLFASLSIILDKPFVIGDFIIVDDKMGVVQQIGLKTTRLRSLSGEQLIFSNSDLLSSRVRNFKRMQERRISFPFGVTYQTTPEQLESIPTMMKEIIESKESLRFDRAHFKSFGASSYDFEVVYFVQSSDVVMYLDAQQAINIEICRRFAENGIEFAYPTQTLFLNKET